MRWLVDEYKILMISVFLVVMSSQGVFAGSYKSKLTLWGSFRLRYEVQDNFNLKSYGKHPVLGKEDDSFLLARVRLGCRYKVTKNILISLGIQHSMVEGLALNGDDFYNPKFGREHNPYKDYFEPFDTYIKIAFSKFYLKAGRQTIFYGDKRVFGPGQWGNTGSWVWDAIKCSYKHKWGFVDVYYGRTIIHDPSVFSLAHRHGFESMGFYSQIKKSLDDLNIGIEPFFFTKKDNHNRYKGEDGKYKDLDTYYLGARLFIKEFHGIDLDATYIIQQGDYANDEVYAYAYHILAGYHMKKVLFTPYVSVEYSYASGDKDPNDGKHNTFDAAFGARDKMYGRINLFKWQNIKDLQFNLELSPFKKIYVKTEYHRFWLAEKRDGWSLNPKVYRDKTGSSGDEVGREFDLITKIKLPLKNEVQIGYSHFWPGEFAKKMASNSEANWFFLQWKLSF